MAVFRLPRCFLFVLSLCITVAAIPPPLLTEPSLERRYVTGFSAPTNYRYSWGIDEHRCSYANTSGQYISRTQIAGATSVTQKEVNACATICEQTLKCGFFHPIQMKGGSEGNVICALYTAKQDKESATYTAGTAQSGGSVIASYGFTRSSPVSRTSSAKRSTTSRTSLAVGSSRANRIASASSTKSTETTTRPGTSTVTRRSSPTSTTMVTHTSLTTPISTRSSSFTNRSSSTTTSTTLSLPVSSNLPSRSISAAETATLTSTATSSSSSSSPSTPVSPSGANLIQFQGCSSSSNTVPMFVSKNYPSDKFASSASTVWIVQHGSSRNFDDYFSSVHSIVGDAGVVIAPNFYATGDSATPNSWYQPNSNLAWSGNTWSLGEDAISPSGVTGCSSFDVYDSIITSLHDRTRYPNLQRIFVVAHSAGSAMMGRYGMLSDNIDIKYVLANAPAMPYFTTARPNSTSGCRTYNSWGYGWAASLPRYVSSRSPAAVQAFRNWVTRDITLMTGDFDTYSRDSTGDQTCNVQAQGGQNRRDRGYAFWAYINLLAGTSTDVSGFYGYESLRSQVTSVLAPKFSVRYCVVDGVAHDNDAMFASACGRAAINGEPVIPAGPASTRPS